MQLDTALIHLLGCGVGVRAASPPSACRAAAALPWLVASVLIHIGYYIALVGAYRHGELGFAYPIMRGTAPLLVALASGSLIGEHLALAAWLGVAGISAGVLAIGLTRSARQRIARRTRSATRSPTPPSSPATRSSTAWACAPRAMRFAYVALLFLVDGLPYFAIVLWQRRAALAPSFVYMRARWPVALLGACASLGAYGIALWAMTRAPVASVAALRETSVLFAALIGVVVLKERFRLQRALGTGAVAVGVMALRLA